jgi:hypothetical protein
MHLSISTIYLDVASSTLPLNRKITTYMHVACQARIPDYFGKDHLCVTHSTAVGKVFSMPITPKVPRWCAINIDEPKVQLNSYIRNACNELYNELYLI